MVLSTILAGAGGVFSLYVGVAMIVGGTQAKSVSDEYGFAQSSSAASDVTGYGVVLLCIALGVLAAAVAAGIGKNVGRVITILWMSLCSFYVVARTIDAGGDDAAGFVVIFLIYPVVTVLGLITSRANAYFRRPEHPLPAWY